MGNRQATRKPSWLIRFQNDLSTVIDQAREGNKSKASEILFYFSCCVRDGYEVDGRVMTYLARAFLSTLKAGATSRAITDSLNLTGKPGRPRKNDDRDEEIYLEIVSLKRSGHPIYSSKTEKEPAVAIVANQHPLDEDAVGQIYKRKAKERRELERFLEELQ